MAYNQVKPHAMSMTSLCRVRAFAVFAQEFGGHSAEGRQRCRCRHRRGGTRCRAVCSARRPQQPGRSRGGFAGDSPPHGELDCCSPGRPTLLLLKAVPLDWANAGAQQQPHSVRHFKPNPWTVRSIAANSVPIRCAGHAHSSRRDAGDGVRAAAYRRRHGRTAGVHVAGRPRAADTRGP